MMTMWLEVTVSERRSGRKRSSDPPAARIAAPGADRPAGRRRDDAAVALGKRVDAGVLVDLDPGLDDALAQAGGESGGLDGRGDRVEGGGPEQRRVAAGADALAVEDLDAALLAELGAGLDDRIPGVVEVAARSTPAGSRRG